MLDSEQVAKGRRVTAPGGHDFDVSGSLPSTEGDSLLVLQIVGSDVYGSSILVPAYVVRESWEANDDQEAVQESRQEEYDDHQASLQDTPEEDPEATDATGATDDDGRV